LNFGNDGKLYITTGNTSPEFPNSWIALAGKILRINKAAPFPTDNPFYDGAGAQRRLDLGLAG